MDKKKKTRRLLQYPRKDILGNVYGKLTVTSFYGYIVSNITNYRESWWVCKCACGKSKILRTGSLICGKASSCGCLIIENMKRVAKSNIGTKRNCSQATREKIRNTLLSTYQKHPEILETRKRSGKNQFSGGYSSIEKLIADALNSLGVHFYHNHKVRKYFPDFIIFDNVIIECDGGYWHRDKEKDNKRDSCLMQHGFYIFRLSEERIIAEPLNCIISIISILHHMGHPTASLFESKRNQWQKLKIA